MRAFTPRSSLALTPFMALATGGGVHADTLPGGVPSASPAAMIQVSNCNDAGPGSLRAVVAGAASGDTIDLRSLDCRRIDLASGSVKIAQDDLTLLGPPGTILVAGNQAAPVFEHSGSGTLRVRAMTIAHGYHEGATVTGGCIDSRGDLRLEWTRVHDCATKDNAGRPDGGGGGIAANDIALYNSAVFANHASNAGGGILATGHLTLVRSRVGNNRADVAGGGFNADGGLYARRSEISGNSAGDSEGAFYAHGGDLTVIGSLISGNYSEYWIPIGFNGSSILIANTTISGNATGGNFSALVIDATDETSIVNSTIVNNVEQTRTTDRECAGAISFFGELHLESTIVARNTCDGVPLDITNVPPIVGSDNLVQVSTAPLPPDTISADPRISPLADNGGRTRTHRLWRSSPAVDMGNNAAGLRYDQRGPGFPRVKGGRADIGAYER